MIKVTIEIDASNQFAEMERDELRRTIKTTEVHTFQISDGSAMKELEAADKIRAVLKDIIL